MGTLLVLLVFLAPGFAWASAEELFDRLNRLGPSERQQRLIEGAKKEKEVLLYSSSGLEEIRALQKAFTKKYPFLQFRFNRKGGSQLFEVAFLEFSGKKYLADVYWAGVSTVGPMLKHRGMLARYVSPERQAVPEEYRDREGYWTGTRISMAIFAYNAKKVPQDKVPKTYPDLLDPFWKRKFSLDSNPGRFTYLLAQRWDWEKLADYHKKLAQQEPQLHRGRAAGLQLLLAGEVTGALDINADNIIGVQKQGAPLDYAVMDPTLLSLTALAMPHAPAHPHAAALLYDFILSADGQSVLAAEDNMPIREGVEATSKELMKRYKEGRAQKKFIIQSPATFDHAQEDKYNRLYIDTLVKKAN
ncbi:MAG TPA: ABC transporter substrate-binding protein [Candidatus Acidoferrales bacterium]|nr:ABC transporter substrate-binding protein [Candidatus Acidoferrales bacterium]